MSHMSVTVSFPKWTGTIILGLRFELTVEDTDELSAHVDYDFTSLVSST